jgi:glucose-1-phosphate thymidylyltransferase
MSDRLSSHISRQKKSQRTIIGLVPAAGKAARLSPLPFSKELYPVGFQRLDNGRSLHPKPVCVYLLEKMRLAGTTEAYIVLRKGKWDIPAYLCDGKMLNMHLAYLMMDLPFGVPYTLDQAYPFVQDAIVAFGFPDIIFQPEDAFVQLITRQAESNADIVLGLFPTDKPQKWDMVHLDQDGRIQQIIIKPPHTHLRYTWTIAIWTPVFTRFMHEYVAGLQGLKKRNSAENNSSEPRELFVGDVIQAAIQNDMGIDTVVFPDGSCLDIGTPEDMIRAAQISNRIS